MFKIVLTIRTSGTEPKVRANGMPGKRIDIDHSADQVLLGGKREQSRYSPRYLEGSRARTRGRMDADGSQQAGTSIASGTVGSTVRLAKKQ